MSIPDTTLAGSPIGNLSAFVAMMNAHATTRVAHVFIGNSNGVHYDTGMCKGLMQWLASSGYRQFDFGSMGSLHAMSGTDDGGMFGQKRRTSPPPGTQSLGGTKSVGYAANLVSGTYTSASKTLVFTGQQLAIGRPDSGKRYPGVYLDNGAGGDGSLAIEASGKNTVVNVAGTGVTLTTSNVVSVTQVTTTTTIVLSSDIGAPNGTSNISLTLIPCPKITYDLMNLPAISPTASLSATTGYEYDTWRPLGDGFAHHVSGATAMYSQGVMQIYKHKTALGINARLKPFYMVAKYTSGVSGFKIDGYNVNLQQAASIGSRIFAGSTQAPTAGATDGEIAWLTDTGYYSLGLAGRDSPDGYDSVAIGPGLDTASTGDITLLYSHLVNMDQATGWSMNPWMMRGGMGCFRFAKLLGTASAAGVANVSGQISNMAIETSIRSFAHQGSSAAGGSNAIDIVFHICDSYNSFGTGNDNDGYALNSNSLGPTPAASNTPAGRTDNLQGVIYQLTARCAAAGVSEGVTVTPRFVLYNEWPANDVASTGTPAGYVTTADYERWRQLGAISDSAFANTTTNVCHIDFAKLITSREVLNTGLSSYDAADTVPASSPYSSNSRHGSYPLYSYLYGKVGMLANQAIGSAGAKGQTSGSGVSVQAGGFSLRERSRM